jgi:RNA polymerase sigma-70 factor (ECF subfamily)
VEAYFVDRGQTEQRRRTVEQALQILPDDQRQVVVLKVWGELTFAQIASALDISPNTAASRFRYALRRMRDQMDKAAKP